MLNDFFRGLPSSISDFGQNVTKFFFEIFFWEFDHDASYFQTLAPNTCYNVTIDTLCASFMKMGQAGCQKFRVEFGQNHFFHSTGQTVDIFADENIMPFVLKLKSLPKRSQSFFCGLPKFGPFGQKVGRILAQTPLLIHPRAY